MAWCCRPRRSRSVRPPRSRTRYDGPTTATCEQETRVDGQVFDAVVQYAFGSGDRGLTLVGRDEKGKAYELRLSEYRDGHGTSWDVTTGHPRNPTRAQEFLGQPLDEDGVRRCLACHVTDPKAILDRSARVRPTGGSAARSVTGRAATTCWPSTPSSSDDPAIGRPTLASGSRVVKICAECHSPRGQEVSRDDPMAVRFQGTTLTWSRCYTESNDTLDCMTCHDPHRNVSTSAAYYESRCLSCHSGIAARPRASARAATATGQPRDTPPAR